jgi:hypothetical protein
MACGGCGSGHAQSLVASRHVARSAPVIATNQPNIVTQRHINNGIGQQSQPPLKVQANHLERQRA